MMKATSFGETVFYDPLCNEGKRGKSQIGPASN